MGICVGCYQKVAVPQPFLNFLERYAICQEEARATMAKIMEAYTPEIILLHKDGELSRKIVGPDAVSKSIHIDVSQMFFVIRFAAQLAVGFLR